MQDLVVITGFSGAGKSQAMACFEDAGYFCVDNLPPEMIAGLAELFEHEGSKVERAAVVSDVRGGELFDGLVKVLEELEWRGMPHRLLYLEASEDVLVNRFKETRRRHPLASNGGEGVGGQVSRAIAAERALLEPLRERATVSIDTTDLSAARLRKVVADKMLPRGSVGKLAVTFLTYGFKHGAPRDADLLFDVRFLPNPHYEEELRPLTGLDQAVRDYVESSDGIGELLRAPRRPAGLPPAPVRAGGQGPPHHRHRLHRRAPPLRRYRRAPGRRLRRARHLPRGRGAPRHRQAAAHAVGAQLLADEPSVGSQDDL